MTPTPPSRDSGSPDGKRGRVLTHTANGRTWRLYGCAKRGCDAVNLDYESFGAHGRSYCRNHIPFRARLKVWRRERHA